MSGLRIAGAPSGMVGETGELLVTGSALAVVPESEVAVPNDISDGA